MQPELLATGGDVRQRVGRLRRRRRPRSLRRLQRHAEPAVPQRLAACFADVAAAAGVADARATRAAAWGDYGRRRRSGSARRLRARRRTGAAALSQRRRALRRRDGGSRPRGRCRRRAAAGVGGRRRRRRPRSLRRRSAIAPTRSSGTTGGRFADVAADDRARRHAQERRRGLVRLRRGRRPRSLRRATWTATRTALYRNDKGRFTDVARRCRPRLGRPRAARRRPTAPCGRAPPTSTATDASTSSPRTTARTASSSTAAPGRFEDVSAAWGIAIDARYDTCAFADFDNDGRLDLYVNGTVTGGTSYRDYLFRNTGSRVRGRHAGQHPRARSRPRRAVGRRRRRRRRGPRAHRLAPGRHAPVAAQHAARAGGAAARSACAWWTRRGRATRAGAEVRVYAAGTRRLLGTRLVDTGSGYDAQSDVPVHVGLPSAGRVDVEVIWPSGRPAYRGDEKERRAERTGDSRAGVVSA